MLKRIVLVMVMGLAAACGGDPGSDDGGAPAGHGTNEQVGRVLFGALCERFATCYPEAFGQMYPTGNGACVDRFLQSQPPSTLPQPNACDDRQVAACKADIGVLDCAATSAKRLPTSCGGC